MTIYRLILLYVFLVMGALTAVAMYTEFRRRRFDRGQVRIAFSDARNVVMFTPMTPTWIVPAAPSAGW